MDEIRHEIEKIAESAQKITTLAKENAGIKKNAEIILTFVYLLKFITPEVE
jgi:hypothetical protein